MKAASNTGPLIALAKMDKLDLLPRLFEEVWIPAVVHRELLAKTAPETEQISHATSEFILVAPDAQLSSALHNVVAKIDPGEQHAVDLAYRMRVRLLIDDRTGREAAARCGILITGTAGVLLRAKRAGLIPEVMPLLSAIRDSGYWLLDRLLKEAQEMAGE